jgi:hypothetical protein
VQYTILFLFTRQKISKSEKNEMQNAFKRYFGVYGYPSKQRVIQDKIRRGEEEV